VGLGGRLDAVNVFDPTCAIVTAVDFDHMDFLGNSRESIGFEKAGIFRKGIPAICGDADPPASLIGHARAIGAELQLVGTDFRAEKQDGTWDYHGKSTTIAGLPIPALIGHFQLDNAACVVAAIETLQQGLPISRQQIAQGLAAVRLPGRFQLFGSAPQVILDVAHNPQAALALAQNLRQTPQSNRTLAVFGMLADKDISGVISAVGDQIDMWFLAHLPVARGATAQQVARLIHE